LPSSYPAGLDSLATNKVDGDDMGDATPGSVAVGPHSGHHNDLADAVNKIEAELGINPSGASATVADRFAAITAAVGSTYTLASDVAVGATTITLDRNPELPIVVGTAILLSAHTTRAELRRVLSISGSTITVLAIRTAHDADDVVLAMPVEVVTPRMYGCDGTSAVDVWAPLQRMFLEAAGYSVVIEGLSPWFVYYISQPLMTHAQQVQRITVQPRATVSPVVTTNAAWMHGQNCQDFTASAATDTFTCPNGHGLGGPGSYAEINHTRVVFCTPYGGTLPAPLVAGRVYYFNTTPSTTTFTISATRGGAILDLTTDGAGWTGIQIHELARLYWDKVRLNLHVANLHGFMCSLQQDSRTRDTRIDMEAAASSPGGAIGWTLGGQLSYHDNVETNPATNCIGMSIFGTGHKIRGFDGNGPGTAMMHIESADLISVYDPWTEGAACGIKLAGVCRGIRIAGTWYTTALALQVTATTTSWELDGLIRTPNSNVVLVDDTARGYQLKSWDGGSGGDGDTGQVLGRVRQEYGPLRPVRLGDRPYLAATLVVVGTTYTFVRLDEGKTIEFTNGGAITATVPPNSSVPFSIGAVLKVLQYGAGQVTLAPGAGVTIRSPAGKLKTAAQYAEATLRKRGTDEWMLEGDIAA
jgi:hypothetical protein